MSYDALTKGTDLFLDPSGAQTQFDGYADNPVFRRSVREAVHRYLYVTANYSAALNGVSAGSEIVPVSPWWQTLLTVLQIGFFTLGGAGTVMLFITLTKEKQRRSSGAVQRNGK